MVEVEARAARHEPPVVPQHLPPLRGVALDVHRERGALDDDLALRDPGAIDCRWARSGIVDPNGIERPPSEKSITMRAFRWRGNV